MKQAWFTKWQSAPRRWDVTALMALPTRARVFEDGVYCKRTVSGLSWGIYYRAPVVDGSTRTKTKWETLPHCRNKAQASGVLVTRKGEVFQGTYQPKLRRVEMTIAGFLPDFAKLCAGLKTLPKYQGQIKRQFIQRWGTLPLRALKRADVQAWYAGRLLEQKIATANNELAALRTFYSVAIENDHCEVNPCKGVKLKPANNARDRVLSEPEILKLGDAAMSIDDYARPLFFALYFTGARLSEVLELERASVDPVRAVIRYRDAKDGRVRNVPMHADLVDHMRDWMAKQPEGAYVFPGRFSASHRLDARHGWAELCAAAKVEVTAHELRHNFVSQLQAAGVSDTIIMDLTGHRTLAMLKRYSHSRDHHRAAAVARLPAIGGQSPGNRLLQITRTAT